MDLMFSQPKKSKPVKSSAFSMKEFKMPNYDISSKHMKIKSPKSNSMSTGKYKLSSLDITGSSMKVPAQIQKRVKPMKMKTNYHNHDISKQSLIKKDISSGSLLSNNNLLSSKHVSHKQMGNFGGNMLGTRSNSFKSKGLGDIQDNKLGMIIGDKVTPKQRKVLKSQDWNKIWTDSDGDGVINGLDCDPMNSKRHGFFAKAKNLVSGKGFRENSEVRRENIISKINESTQSKNTLQSELAAAERKTQQAMNKRDTMMTKYYNQNQDEIKRETAQGEIKGLHEYGIKYEKRIFDAENDMFNKQRIYQPEVQKIQDRLEQLDTKLENIPKDRTTYQEIADPIKSSYSKLKEKDTELNKQFQEKNVIAGEKIGKVISSTAQGIQKVTGAIGAGIAKAAEKVGHGIARESIERGYYKLEKKQVLNPKTGQMEDVIDKKGEPVLEKKLDYLRYAKQDTGYFFQNDEARQNMLNKDANLELAKKHKLLAGTNSEQLKKIGALTGSELQYETVTELVPVPGKIDKDKKQVYEEVQKRIPLVIKGKQVYKPAPVSVTNLTSSQLAAIDQMYEETQRARPIQFAQESAALKDAQRKQAASDVNIQSAKAEQRRMNMEQAEYIAGIQPQYNRRPIFEAGPLSPMFISGKRFTPEYKTPVTPGDVELLDTLAVQNQGPNNMRGINPRQDGLMDSLQIQNNMPLMNGNVEGINESIRSVGLVTPTPPGVLDNMLFKPKPYVEPKPFIVEQQPAPQQVPVQNMQPVPRVQRQVQIINKPRVRPPEKPIGYTPEGKPIMRSHHTKPESKPYKKPEWKESKHIDKEGKQIKNKFEDDE